MALIDKNVAFDKINKAYGEGNLVNLKQIINNIPTIDAVPVVHGHWTDGGLVYTCSVCGMGSVNNYRYCHHCGAFMY